MVFVADDLGAWLVGLLADAGRKELTTLVLGSEQERALRQAATAAVQLTARELTPAGGRGREHSSNYGASSGLIKSGGWTSLAAAAFAFYLSLAEVWEASYSREVLPVGHLAKK